MNYALAQQNAQPRGDGVTITQFKDLVYPELARQLRVQGAVVVQAKLDDQGGVVDAVAISGPPMLVPSTLINIKNWRFKPNDSKSAVVVYHFIFIEGRCESHGSLFVLEPSNLATIIGCVPATNP
jgi:outer membrane biosynthesis protein TonB